MHKKLGQQWIKLVDELKEKGKTNNRAYEEYEQAEREQRERNNTLQRKLRRM